MRQQQLCINSLKIPVDNIDWCKTAETLNFNSGKLLLFWRRKPALLHDSYLLFEKGEKSTSRYSNQKWRTGAEKVGLEVRLQSERRARRAENVLEILVDLFFSPW